MLPERISCLGVKPPSVSRPAIEKYSAQGVTDKGESSVIHIARLLRLIFDNATRISVLEEMRGCIGKKLDGIPMVNGSIVNYDSMSELVDDSIRKAIIYRDRNIESVKYAIDYALTTEAYYDSLCSACRLPLDALMFIKIIAEFEPPNVRCDICKGLGTVRLERVDKVSVSNAKKIKHFRNVLEDTILVSKVRAKSSDSNSAYLSLELKYKQLMFKFGNESQTSLEREDAEQGVRQGIIDACQRYDPTHSKMASFSTVAYSWAFRNSRARKNSQKRPGVYAPSCDGMIRDLESGRTIVDELSSKQGALASTSVLKSDGSLAMDMRDGISRLPKDQANVMRDMKCGFTLKQIAARHNFSTKEVSLLRGQAFNTLREFLSVYKVEALHD
jgi:DNA-directed RNA polymerase specialized sigma24 family protein